MKPIIAFITLLTSIITIKVQAQVEWKFSTQKIAENVFEVHLSANIENGWHLYSQTQPPEAVANPSIIRFDHSPFIQLQGNIREVGRLELYENKDVGIKSYQYRSHVDFVQTIKIKQSKKAIFSGSISFTLCNQNECLPTSTKLFSVEIL